MIEILINDIPTPIGAETSVAEALLEHAEPDQPYAIAINGEFVPRSLYAATYLKAGDALDIVSPVGGG